MCEYDKVKKVIEFLLYAENDARDAKMYAVSEGYERMVKYLGCIIYNLHCAKEHVMRLTENQHEFGS